MELALPERAVAPIRDAGLPRPVSLVFAARPEQSYAGTLFEVSTQLGPQEDANVCRAKVRFATAPPAELRLAGAEVRAKVEARSHALGYVLFRDVIDWLRERLFF